LQRLRASLWTDRESPTRGSGLRLRTRLSMGAGTTILHGKFDRDHRVAASILRRRPTAPRLARRTGGAFALPIHDKLFGGKSGSFACLPMIIVSGRPKEIDSIVVLAVDERFCIHVTSIHQMSFG